MRRPARRGKVHVADRSARPAVTHRVSHEQVRRRCDNVQELYRRFVAERVAIGERPMGIEAAFAARIQVSPSVWSQVKGMSRPISDKLARQIEACCGVDAGWLDEDHGLPGEISDAERSLMELALRAYRSVDAEGRRALRRHLEGLSKPGQAS